MKILFALILTCFYNTYFAWGQVTIRTDVIEQAVFKPLSYDSLTDFKWEEVPADFYKYIGQSIYFPLVSGKYFFEDIGSYHSDTVLNFVYWKKEEELTNPSWKPYDGDNLLSGHGRTDSIIMESTYYVEGKLDHDKKLKVQTNLYAPYCLPQTSWREPEAIAANSSKVFRGKAFKIIDVLALDDKGNQDNFKDLKRMDNIEAVRFFILSGQNGDTLFFDFREREKDLGMRSIPFCLLGYYQKQRNSILGKKFIWSEESTDEYEEENRKGDFVEIKTGEILKLKLGSMWTCSEVSFLETKENVLFHPFYILKDKEGKEIKIEFNSMQNSKFQDLLVYQEEKRKNQKNSAEYLAYLKQRQAENALQNRQKTILQNQFRDMVIKKYGIENAKIILAGKVSVGMNSEMCKLAWGIPIDINRTTNVKGVSEQWVYSMKHYLYFKDGVLITIQN